MKSEKRQSREMFVDFHDGGFFLGAAHRNNQLQLQIF